MYKYGIIANDGFTTFIDGDNVNDAITCYAKMFDEFTDIKVDALNKFDSVESLVKLFNELVDNPFDEIKEIFYVGSTLYKEEE